MDKDFQITKSHKKKKKKCKKKTSVIQEEPIVQTEKVNLDEKIDDIPSNPSKNQMIFRDEFPISPYETEEFDNKLFKRVLCNNMFIEGNCPYGNFCHYAHSLDEQIVDPLRKKIYHIISSNELLNDIDLFYDIKLFSAFKQLTRLCLKCEKKECLGGYNCKYGACNAKYVICYTDLYYGKCTGACTKIHLTKRGLIPYNLQFCMYNRPKSNNNDDNHTIRKSYIDLLVSNVRTPTELNNLLGEAPNKKEKTDENSDASSLSLNIDDNIDHKSEQEFIITIYSS